MIGKTVVNFSYDIIRASQSEGKIIKYFEILLKINWIDSIELQKVENWTTVAQFFAQFFFKQPSKQNQSTLKLGKLPFFSIHKQKKTHKYLEQTFIREWITKF